MDWRQNKQAVHCELRSKSFRCLVAMRTLESQRYCGLNALSVDISEPLWQWQEVRSFSGDLKSGRLSFFFFLKNGLRTLRSTVHSSHTNMGLLDSAVCSVCTCLSYFHMRLQRDVTGFRKWANFVSVVYDLPNWLFCY